MENNERNTMKRIYTLTVLTAVLVMAVFSSHVLGHGNSSGVDCTYITTIEGLPQPLPCDDATPGMSGSGKLVASASCGTNPNTNASCGAHGQQGNE